MRYLCGVSLSAEAAHVPSHIGPDAARARDRGDQRAAEWPATPTGAVAPVPLRRAALNQNVHVCDAEAVSHTGTAAETSAHYGPRPPAEQLGRPAQDLSRMQLQAPAGTNAVGRL